MRNYDASYVSCISHLLKFVSRLWRHASNLVTYEVKKIYIYMPLCLSHVCNRRIVN